MEALSVTYSCINEETCKTTLPLAKEQRESKNTNQTKTPFFSFPPARLSTVLQNTLTNPLAARRNSVYLLGLCREAVFSSSL